MDLTTEQLDWLRKAIARERLEAAAPQMMEALKKAEAALDFVLVYVASSYVAETKAKYTLESVRAAIAAAE